MFVTKVETPRYWLCTERAELVSDVETQTIDFNGMRKQSQN